MSKKNAVMCAGLVLIAGLLGGSGEAFAQLNQTGVVGKFSSEDDVSNFTCRTSITTWVTLADRIFTQGGSGADEIAVTFSGVFSSNFAGDDQAVVRLVVGVNPQDHSGGGVVMYSNDDDATEAHSYTFISNPPGIQPGSKRVRIQMRSSTGNGVCVGERAMVIWHK